MFQEGEECWIVYNNGVFPGKAKSCWKDMRGEIISFDCEVSWGLVTTLTTQMFKTKEEGEVYRTMES